MVSNVFCSGCNSSSLIVFFPYKSSSTQWIHCRAVVYRNQSLVSEPKLQESRLGPLLAWTSLQNSKNNDTTFFSAHYDKSKGAPLRGTVTVLGYMKNLKNIELYCALIYAN